jgi:hypothetical protein
MMMPFVGGLLTPEKGMGGRFDSLSLSFFIKNAHCFFLCPLGNLLLFLKI